MTRIIIIEPRYDSTGKLIQEHDVLKDIQTGEIALVVRGKNKSGVRGLAVENENLMEGNKALPFTLESYYFVTMKEWKNEYCNFSRKAITSCCLCRSDESS